MLSVSKIFFFILLCGPIVGATHLWGNNPDVPEELLTYEDQSISEEDDFNPALGIFALIMFLGMCILLGVGIALALLFCIILSILAFFGIVSSSVVFGFIKKNPASAFRMLFLQFGAVAGLFCGLAGTFVASWIVDFPWREYLLYGSVTGVLCGLFVAWLFNCAWGGMHGQMTIRYEARRGNVKVIETRTDRF
jgi:MFS family permease